MNKGIIRGYVKLLMLAVTLFSSTAFAVQAVQLEFGYEPFLLKQINPEIRETYQNGILVDQLLINSERDLLFHLAYIRLANNWALPYKDTSIRIKTGFSVSPFPIVKRWTTTIPQNFTGTVGRVTVPFFSVADSYWDGHGVGTVSADGRERYLSEETSLSYIPLLFSLEKIFPLNNKFQFGAELRTGFTAFYISTRRKRLIGSPGTNFTITERSTTHIARNVGAGLKIGYQLGIDSIVFFNAVANAVSNISNVEVGEFGERIGYRFDGLRYNYKLGVQWKI